MAVNQQTPRNVSTAVAGSTVFPYNFKIIAAGDLLVTVNGVQKTLNVDYTVDGVGLDAGGNVTFTVAMAGGEVVMRKRNMAFQRTTDFQNLGDLLSSTLNNDQDAPVLMAQQLSDAISQALRLPADSTASAQLPALVPLAPLVVNAAGNGLQMGSPTQTGDMALRPDLGDGVTAGKGAELVQVDGTRNLRQWIANLLTSAGAALVGFIQSGAGAVLRTIQARLRDTLNAADFGVVGDNATDNQAALQAVITEAQNRGGATILLPPGIVRHTGQILIQCNNIKLRGFGSSMTHDGGTPVYGAGTWLRYVGATAQDQVVFASATGATSQKQLGGGLEDVWLDGNGVATRNLVVRSWNSGEFRNVYCAAATTACVQVDVQSAALAEANDSQRNVFERIYADAGVSAHGYWLDGASGFGNASFNNFINCTGRHKNGHMFVLANCDNNVFDTCGGFRTAGGTGLGVELRGSNTSGLVARSNHFRHLSTNGGVTARGTTSYTYASLRNTITGYDTDNGSPTPTIEAGATLAWKRDDAYSFGEAFVQMIVGGTLAGAQNARSALGNESLRIHDGTQNAVRIGNGTQEWAIRIDGSGNLNILRIAGSGAFTVSNVAQANNMVLTAAAAAPSAGQVALGSTTATTVGAAGAASALPSAPLGYLIAYVGTTPVKIPYYN